MLSWFKQLDDLLRGRTTHPERMREGNVELSLHRFVALLLLLGGIYGFFMGWYGIIGNEEPRYMQLVASTVKLPALFLLTLVVTFPSLYVFNALIGCRLSFTATLRLLVGAIAVNLAVAASFGPILGFFTLSTDSYSFMILLNVALLTVAGLVGLGFLLQTLRRLAFVGQQPDQQQVPTAFPAAQHPPGETPTPPTAPGESRSQGAAPSTSPGALPSAAPKPRGQQGPMERLPMALPDSALGQSHNIFKVWVVIYGLVGAQMGWILRPFIGNPGQDFEWFRERQGNFFESVLYHLQNLFTG